jgi:hypothetical protein
MKLIIIVIICVNIIIKKRAFTTNKTSYLQKHLVRTTFSMTHLGHPIRNRARKPVVECVAI